MGLLLAFSGSDFIGPNIEKNEVYVYEPLSGQWQTQKVTGQIPPAIQLETCIIGVEGDEGTYEVLTNRTVQRREWLMFDNLDLRI